MIPRIIKNNGNREPFNEEKLRAGIYHALEKRPVSEMQIEAAVNRIMHTLQATGEREVPSKMVGTLVMNELKKMDKVAYIRFASVYLSFDDIKQFSEEIDKLNKE